MAFPALLVASCGGEPSAGRAFKPVKPGVLTVATGFVPAPGDRAIATTAEWVAG